MTWPSFARHQQAHAGPRQPVQREGAGNLYGQVKGQAGSGYGLELARVQQGCELV